MSKRKSDFAPLKRSWSFCKIINFKEIRDLNIKYDYYVSNFINKNTNTNGFSYRLGVKKSSLIIIQNLETIK